LTLIGNIRLGKVLHEDENPIGFIAAPLGFPISFQTPKG
jgi:hypothetical protein